MSAKGFLLVNRERIVNPRTDALLVQMLEQLISIAASHNKQVVHMLEILPLLGQHYRR